METPETLPYPCEKCGACCRHIGGAPECEQLDRGDGVCKYYDEKRKECKIYDSRPEICNVTKLYKRYKDKMTWEEWVNENKRCCQVLRDLEKNEK
jgi:Fe-S-cluster containining protein